MGCDYIRLNPANSIDGKFERSVVSLTWGGSGQSVAPDQIPVVVSVSKV
jgi:hypothetical protein